MLFALQVKYWLLSRVRLHRLTACDPHQRQKGQETGLIIQLSLRQTYLVKNQNKTCWNLCSFILSFTIFSSGTY